MWLNTFCSSARIAENLCTKSNLSPEIFFLAGRVHVGLAWQYTTKTESWLLLNLCFTNWCICQNLCNWMPAMPGCSAWCVYVSIRKDFPLDCAQSLKIIQHCLSGSPTGQNPTLCKPSLLVKLGTPNAVELLVLVRNSIFDIMWMLCFHIFHVFAQ